MATDINENVAGSAYSATELQEIPVSTASPADEDVLTYNASSGMWEPAEGGGGTPTGTANRAAVFNSSGDLASGTKFTYTNTRGSIALGEEVGTGTFSSTGAGSLTLGLVDDGTIDCGGNGGIAGGEVSEGTLSVGSGAIAMGTVYEPGSQIASGPNSITIGSAFGGAVFTNESPSGPGLIIANSTQRNVTVSGNASFIFAEQDNAGGEVIVSGAGSGFIGTSTGGDTTVSGHMSVAIGGGNSTVASDQSVAIGHGHDVSSFACLAIGRYAAAAGGNMVSWDPVDPVFVVGDGSSAGARSNSFQIDKDGRVTETASRKQTAIRIIDDTYTIDARIDYRILANCETVTAGTILNLPPGEDGLEIYIFGYNPTAVPTGDYVVTPDGTDVIDAALGGPGGVTLAANSILHMFFYQGTWFPVSL